jgi:hypothetical protein
MKPGGFFETSELEPCASRRGQVRELDSVFLHFCRQCGRFAASGYGVHLRARPIRPLVLWRP